MFAFASLGISVIGNSETVPVIDRDSFQEIFYFKTKYSTEEKLFSNRI